MTRDPDALEVDEYPLVTPFQPTRPLKLATDHRLYALQAACISAAKSVEAKSVHSARPSGSGRSVSLAPSDQGGDSVPSAPSGHRTTADTRGTPPSPDIANATMGQRIDLTTPRLGGRIDLPTSPRMDRAELSKTSGAESSSTAADVQDGRWVHDRYFQMYPAPSADGNRTQPAKKLQRAKQGGAPTADGSKSESKPRVKLDKDQQTTQQTKQQAKEQPGQQPDQQPNQQLGQQSFQQVNQQVDKIGNKVGTKAKKTKARKWRKARKKSSANAAKSQPKPKPQPKAMKENNDLINKQRAKFRAAQSSRSSRKNSGTKQKGAGQGGVVRGESAAVVQATSKKGRGVQEQPGKKSDQRMNQQPGKKSDQQKTQQDVNQCEPDCDQLPPSLTQRIRVGAVDRLKVGTRRRLGEMVKRIGGAAGSKGLKRKWGGSDDGAADQVRMEMQRTETETETDQTERSSGGDRGRKRRRRRMRRGPVDQDNGSCA